MRIKIVRIHPGDESVPLPGETRVLRWARHAVTGDVIKMFCQGTLGVYPDKTSIFLVLQTPYWEEGTPGENVFAAQEGNSLENDFDVLKPYAMVKVEIPPQPLDLEIKAGDRVAIHADGRVLNGKIINAVNWGQFGDEPPNWFLEYTIDPESRLPGRGDYGYWKQGEDGGWVELLD